MILLQEKIAKLMAKSTTGLRFEEIRREGFETESIVRHELKEMETRGYVKRSGVANTTRYELTTNGRMMFIVGNEDVEVKSNVEVEPIRVPSDVALNPELFELVKVIDEKNAAIFELFNRKPKQFILNRENKINELHKLCGSGILSNGTVAILNDIIGDLQVE